MPDKSVKVRDKIHRFKYNGLAGTQNNVEDVGYIAQEVEEVLPEFVKSKRVKLQSADPESTEIKTVNYSRFVYVAINAVKELYAKWFQDSQVLHRELASVRDEVEKKNLEIRELERKNQELESRVERIEKILEQKK